MITVNYFSNWHNLTKLPVSDNLSIERNNKPEVIIQDQFSVMRLFNWLIWYTFGWTVKALVFNQQYTSELTKTEHFFKTVQQLLLSSALCWSFNIIIYCHFSESWVMPLSQNYMKWQHPGFISCPLYFNRELTDGLPYE